MTNNTCQGIKVFTFTVCAISALGAGPFTLEHCESERIVPIFVVSRCEWYIRCLV